MQVARALWMVLLATSALVNGKLVLDSLDLESNLIGGVEPVPQQPRRLRPRDWVKFSHEPPSVINTRLGDRIEIECEAFGTPYPEIQWLRGDRAVTSIRKRDSNGLTKVKSRLVIDCVTRKHEGFYTCSATAGSNTIKAGPTLVLVEGIGHGDLELCSAGHRQTPRITSWTPTAMEGMGSTLQLPCAVVGNPKPSVYWIDPHNNILNSIRHTVSSNGELSISQLAWSDMGQYTCVAENSEGKDQVSTFVYPMENSK